MNKPDFDPLLNDLLTDSGYAGFRAGLKRQSLGAFRRARMWRRVRAVGIAAVLAGAGVSALLWQTAQQSPFQTAAVRTGAVAVVATPPEDWTRAPTNATTQIETISDEELLASFPRGSCFLAEIDGQTVLVFTDPKLRDEVLR